MREFVALSLIEHPGLSVELLAAEEVGIKKVTRGEKGGKKETMKEERKPTI